MAKLCLIQTPGPSYQSPADCCTLPACQDTPTKVDGSIDEKIKLTTLVKRRAWKPAFMSTLPPDALKLARAANNAAGIPFVIGIWASFICFGALFVQVPVFFTSSRRLLRRTQLLGLIFILTLTTACALVNLVRLVQVAVMHWGDFDYVSKTFRQPVQVAGFYLSIALVACCQAFLLHRCFYFGKFHAGNTRWRIAYLTLIACLSALGATMSIVAQKKLSDFKSLQDITQQTHGFHTRSLYETAQALGFGLGLAVDVLITIIVSKDLLGAIAYNRNDVNVGVPLRTVLHRLLRLTVTNGAVLVALQVAILTAYATSTTAWAIAGLAALPSLQTVSLLSYLCSPHLHIADRPQDDVELNLESALDSGLRSFPSPSAGKGEMTMVERARRKLPAAASTGRGKAKKAWKVFARPIGWGARAIGAKADRIPMNQMPRKSG